MAPHLCPSSPDNDDHDVVMMITMMMNMKFNDDYLMIVKGGHEAKNNAGNGEQVEHCVQKLEMHDYC